MQRYILRALAKAKCPTLRGDLWLLSPVYDYRQPSCYHRRSYRLFNRVMKRLKASGQIVNTARPKQAQKYILAQNKTAVTSGAGQIEQLDSLVDQAKTIAAKLRAEIEKTQKLPTAGRVIKPRLKFGDTVFVWDRDRTLGTTRIFVGMTSDGRYQTFVGATNPAELHFKKFADYDYQIDNTTWLEVCTWKNAELVKKA